MKKDYTKIIIYIDLILLLLMLISGISLAIETNQKQPTHTKTNKEFYQCMINNNNNFSKCKNYIK